MSIEDVKGHEGRLSQEYTPDDSSIPGYCLGSGNQHRVRNCIQQECIKNKACAFPGLESRRPLPERMPRRTEAPTEAQRRKQRPLITGCLDYFPDALLEVAYCSFVGNEQHNPGEPLHWARGKSTDEADALGRHLLQRGTRDTDGVRHSAKVAWRALALLQKEIEAERNQTTSREET